MNKPRWIRRPAAPDSVHARALHRAGRRPRGSAEEVLPPQPGQGSAAALRLNHQGVGVDKAADGTITALRCSYDPDSKGPGGDTKRVQATIHWVSAAHGLRADVRLYDRLFTSERPGAGDSDFLAEINPTALEQVRDCVVEPSLAGAAPETRYQFERLGYFVVDKDSVAERLVFNRTVTLRDQWAKINKGQK